MFEPGVASRVDELGEPIEAGLRRALGVAVGVLAQDARAAVGSR